MIKTVHFQITKTGELKSATVEKFMGQLEARDAVIAFKKEKHPNESLQNCLQLFRPL